MNIFVLDENIEKCAQYHCDQHVVKMILEGAQILCTALNKKGFTTPYKSTHSKHPCVLWVEASYDNFDWLYQLTLALNKEYKFRYEKLHDHKSIAVLAKIRDQHYPRIGLTPFAQAMPQQYKVKDNAVLAYRQFYIAEKSRFAKWTRRQPPAWF